jgi:hypothetical protein
MEKGRRPRAPKSKPNSLRRTRNTFRVTSSLSARRPFAYPQPRATTDYEVRAKPTFGAKWCPLKASLLPRSLPPGAR